jgi:hypothetical protein
MHTAWVMHSTIEASLNCSLVQDEVQPRHSHQMRRQVLHAVADTLEASGAVRGRVERILPKTIRVPLLRFVEAETGVVCDVSCCNDAAVLKAELLKSVIEVDSRTVHIIRLVCLPFPFSSVRKRLVCCSRASGFCTFIQNVP